VSGVALVAAVARNGVIGRDNQLLWRIKADLRHFRDLTLGRPVLMGRKTFLSIGRPLPGRDTIVLTRDAGFSAEGATICHHLDEALEAARRLGEARGATDVMVAGGGDIYGQTIAMAERLHITEVDLSPEGDAWFPQIDGSIWREVRRSVQPKGPDDDAAYAFVDYVRRKKPRGR
jgi:dihydrofolate reductase